MPIKFAVFYNIIIITAGILNGILLYVFVTKSALRKPSNLVLSTLLWKSVFLMLTAMPVTLLELCIEDVRKNHYLVAICYTVLYMAKLLYCYSYWFKQSANS